MERCNRDMLSLSGDIIEEQFINIHKQLPNSVVWTITTNLIWHQF